MLQLKNFFTSGYVLDEVLVPDLKHRYQMTNIALILSSVAFFYGVIVNSIENKLDFMIIEEILIVMNVGLFFLLRAKPAYFEYVVNIITAQCTFLLLYIIYESEPAAMKHVWLFTYPIVLMYFQSKTRGIYWFVFMILMLIIAPLQPFIAIEYSLFQMMYIVLVLSIVGVIIFFYQEKMREIRNVILEQQAQLIEFNETLGEEVAYKTEELLKVNQGLEEMVKLKVEQLVEQEKLMNIQSKQAVMGEMISMIAHQWRQPLSTITLQISNLQIKDMLGEHVTQENFQTTLSEISNTVIYLSETIDDFQTYFHPKKELQKIELHELLQKAVTFISPRTKELDLEIKITSSADICIETSVNELIQVIINILNNAVDVLLSDNIVHPELIIDLEEDENFVIIHIKDNAGGISLENIDKVFEPYFSTKGKNGTGLGLYMSQMIVQKQFNGNISVKSSPNGTHFSVKIQKEI